MCVPWTHPAHHPYQDRARQKQETGGEVVRFALVHTRAPPPIFPQIFQKKCNNVKRKLGLYSPNLPFRVVLMDNLSKTIPEWAINLRQCRQAQGYTQEGFGRFFDVSGMAVSYWESGRTEPPARALVWILLARGVIPKGSIVDDTLPPITNTSVHD